MPDQTHLPETLEGLTVKAVEFLREIVDGNAEVTSIQTCPMGDGSDRWCSLIHLVDPNGEEATYRVSSPAPKGAPAWAASWTEYLVEDVSVDHAEAV
jgi:hypothetical protein